MKKMKDICKVFCANQDPLWWVWGLLHSSKLSLPGRSGGSHTPSLCWDWSGSTEPDALTWNTWWQHSHLGHCHELWHEGNSSLWECLHWGNLWEEKGTVSRFVLLASVRTVLGTVTLTAPRCFCPSAPGIMKVSVSNRCWMWAVAPPWGGRGRWQSRKPRVSLLAPSKLTAARGSASVPMVWGRPVLLWTCFCNCHPKTWQRKGAQLHRVILFCLPDS